jgi:hypothetical protein
VPAFYLRASVAWVRKTKFSQTMIHLTLFFTVGATIVGRISDQTVIQWRRKRKGLWYPEDRLRAALIPFAIIVPLSVLTFGLVNKFVDGNLGLALSLVCLFSTGVGVSGTNITARNNSPPGYH